MTASSSSTPEGIILEKMRPLLDQHADMLSKLPNPMTIYLVEVVAILFLYVFYPSMLRTFFLRLCTLPTMIATTILYFVWSMNDMLRSTAGLRELEKRNKEIEKKKIAVERSTEDICRLTTKIENLIVECETSCLKK